MADGRLGPNLADLEGQITWKAAPIEICEILAPIPRNECLYTTKRKQPKT
jgi:hypothetical protein